MNLKWKLEAQNADLTAVVSRNADGFTATIDGEILTPMQAGDSSKPLRILQDQPYGPVEVRASSLDELKQAIEDKIAHDGYPFVAWRDD